MSNLASWWPDFISAEAPAWLQTQSADRMVFWCALVGLASTYVPWRSLLGRREPTLSGIGGRGGSVSISGSTRAVGFGGHGGDAGPGGAGGDGGSAQITGGEYAFGMGGDGGEAGQVDRGGRGGRSPLEVMREMGMWDDGLRLQALIEMLRSDYPRLNPNAPNDPKILDAWINDRLTRLDVPCQMQTTDSGYRLEYRRQTRGNDA